jgi:hypothetical protein
MNLLHMTYVDADNVDPEVSEIKLTTHTKPQKDYQHMFCTLKDSELFKDLKTFGITHMSTATIIHHRMSDFNWDLIQTCDI